MAFILSRNEIHLVQLEQNWGVIPNTSGTATLSGSNGCRHTKLELNKVLPVSRRRDKTGNRSLPPGIAGRESGTFQVTMDLAANGTPGVVPDMDPYLQSLFGQAPTVTAGTSVQYTLSDSIPSLDIWSFRKDASGATTPLQRVAVGSVVSSATFDLGNDIAGVTFQGVSKLILGSYDFASRASDGGQSGLSAFPAYPSTFVTNGGIVQGFYGSVTMDGNLVANIKTATLKIETANALTEVFGSKYPGPPEGGVRQISLAWDLYDADDSTTQDLYQRVQDKNPFTVNLTLGNVPGNTWNFTIQGVQASSFTYDDSSNRFIAKFAESLATSTTGLNEISLLIN